MCFLRESERNKRIWIFIILCVYLVWEREVKMVSRYGPVKPDGICLLPQHYRVMTPQRKCEKIGLFAGFTDWFLSPLQVSVSLRCENAIFRWYLRRLRFSSRRQRVVVIANGNEGRLTTYGQLWVKRKRVRPQPPTINHLRCFCSVVECHRTVCCGVLLSGSSSPNLFIVLKVVCCFFLVICRRCHRNVENERLRPCER